MHKIGAASAIFVLFCALGGQSSSALAQCSPTNPDCSAPQPRSGGGTTGGGASVNVDVGKTAKAIGGLFKKKKKKPAEPQVEPKAASVEPPKQDIIFVRNEPVVQKIPRSTRKAIVDMKAKPRAVAQAVKSRSAAPSKTVVRKAAVAAVAISVAEPVVAAELPTPEAPPAPIAAAPVAPVVSAATPIAKSAAVIPAEQVPNDNSLYWIIGAAAAALAASVAAVKLLFTPKISMNCGMADGRSTMISDPKITPPEFSFNVAIPGFAASTPDNLAIIA
jgi:hypothetical protein